MQKAKNSFKAMQKATLVHFLQHFIVNNYLWTALQPPVVVLSWPSFHNLITAIRSQFTFNFLRESRGLRRTDAFSTLLSGHHLLHAYYQTFFIHSRFTSSTTQLHHYHRTNTPRWVSLSFSPVQL